MKKLILSISALFACSYALRAQVGINTETPKTTMDVRGKVDGSGVSLPTDLTGLQAPRLTREELTSKGDGLYGTDQKGALVYITDISGGDAQTQRINVTGVGYYYFDGALWQKISGKESASHWNVESTSTPATLNNQNIYQNGYVGIGNFAAANPIANLDVRGAIRGGTPHADELNGTSAIGVNSVSFGIDNQVRGNHAFTAGHTNILKGQHSVAFGWMNTGHGEGVTLFGSQNQASGANSAVFGTRNIANNNTETIFGYNNAITSDYSPTAIYGPLPLFQIGNGFWGSRNNAFTVLQSGNIGIGINGVNAVAKPTERLDIGSGNVRIRTIYTAAGGATDRVVVADANGVLKTIAPTPFTSGPKIFHSPSLMIPTTNTELPSNVNYSKESEVYTVDLYAIYSEQYGMTANKTGANRNSIKSNASATLPVESINNLDYFVTYFDNTVIDANSVTLSEKGILTYKVLQNTSSSKTAINVVYKVK